MRLLGRDAISCELQLSDMISLLAAPVASPAAAACEPSLRARLALEVASARLECNPDVDLSSCASGACGVGFGGPWDHESCSALPTVASQTCGSAAECRGSPLIAAACALEHPPAAAEGGAAELEAACALRPGCAYLLPNTTAWTITLRERGGEALVHTSAGAVLEMSSIASASPAGVCWPTWKRWVDLECATGGAAVHITLEVAGDESEEIEAQHRFAELAVRLGGGFLVVLVGIAGVFWWQGSPDRAADPIQILDHPWKRRPSAQQVAGAPMM